MNITCPSCHNQKFFRTPLWVRCTFRIEDNGMIKMLHLNQLESLEEKITDSHVFCRTCGKRVRIIFDAYGSFQQEKQQRKTLEGL